jgi:hypothetical protein
MFFRVCSSSTSSLVARLSQLLTALVCVSAVLQHLFGRLQVVDGHDSSLSANANCWCAVCRSA